MLRPWTDALEAFKQASLELPAYRQLQLQRTAQILESTGEIPIESLRKLGIRPTTRQAALALLAA